MTKSQLIDKIVRKVNAKGFSIGKAGVNKMRRERLPILSVMHYMLFVRRWSPKTVLYLFDYRYVQAVGAVVNDVQ